MHRQLVLYSTNTRLAFVINQRYYGQIHWVCCAPYFDSTSLPVIEGTNPPSACPKDIYLRLDGDARRGERHSDAIARNRVGILRGAADKRSKGVITGEQEKDIGDIVQSAMPYDFRPLLYVIPFDLVKLMVKEMPVSERAHPLSCEYTVPKLPRDLFDAIELHGEQ